jgi:CRISPR-associated protein Csm4
MTEWTTYRLRPKPGGAFHFGLLGLEQEDSAQHCPSDTVFAALVATLADLEGDEGVRAFVAPFKAGRPPFLLTSTFPRAGDLPLLPLPSLRLNVEPRPGRRKLFKRLRYVSPTIFKRALAGDPLDPYIGPDSQGAFLQERRIWLTVEEQGALPERWRHLPNRGLREEKVWVSRPIDRVTVDRVSAASAVYRTGRTAYAPGCGLWLGVQWPAGIDSAVEEKLSILLAHLGDRGLGGERSVGYGQFTLHREPLSLQLPTATEAEAAVTLSRYLPREDELPGALRGRASYALDTVAGWLAARGQRAQRRRQVRLLSEGSVFEPAASRPWGRLADVRPAGWDAHPIWRWGYACPVGPARGVVEGDDHV